MSTVDVKVMSLKDKETLALLGSSWERPDAAPELSGSLLLSERENAPGSGPPTGPQPPLCLYHLHISLILLPWNHTFPSPSPTGFLVFLLSQIIQCPWSACFF